MTTESQDLGLTSHPKDGANKKISVLVLKMKHYEHNRPLNFYVKSN